MMETSVGWAGQFGEGCGIGRWDARDSLVKAVTSVSPQSLVHLGEGWRWTGT